MNEEGFEVTLGVAVQHHSNDVVPDSCVGDGRRHGPVEFVGQVASTDVCQSVITRLKEKEEGLTDLLW